LEGYRFTDQSFLMPTSLHAVFLKNIKPKKFSPIENIHYPENRTVNYHKDQYEIFLQLKNALESTGNY
jgi:hypothetical protein